MFPYYFSDAFTMSNNAMHIIKYISRRQIVIDAIKINENT